MALSRLRKLMIQVLGGDVPGGMGLAVAPFEPYIDGGGNVGELTRLEGQRVLQTAKPKFLPGRVARIDEAAVFSTNDRASLEITPGPDPATQPASRRARWTAPRCGLRT
jgi:hypothetical protein